MKKITLFMSLLVLMITGLKANAADVYVETTDPTFNVYTWEPESFGGWPGNTLTSTEVGGTLTTVNGKEYYKFTLETTPGTTRKIIFNKDGKQTSDIPLIEGDNFFTYPVNNDYGKYETTNPPIPITAFTIVGEEGLLGNAWDVADTENDMTLQEDGTFKLVKENLELQAKGYQYKVTANHDWGVWELPNGLANNTLTIEEAGKYNVTFTLDTALLKLDAVAELIEEAEPVVITAFTIVGEEGLLGNAWDVADTDNDMTLQEDGTFKLVKENLELQAKGYQYKVTANHDWGVWELPNGQANNTLTIEEAGKYNVTFTLDTALLKLDAVAELIEEAEPVVITAFTIVGEEGLLGNAWDVADTENDMTLQEDGTFKLVKENLELQAKGYQYKVTANHDWGVWELPNGQANNTLTIEEAGKYNVTFTLDTALLKLDAVAELIEEEPTHYVLHYGLNEEGAEWKDATFVAGDGENEGKLVAANVEFAENTEFGIKYGDIWYAGKPNEGEDYYLIHSEWCVDVPVTANTDGLKNFRINEAGTYTFVLSVDEEGLTLTVNGFSQSPVNGDLNGDGTVDISDVNALINIILGKAEFDPRGDLNNDSEIDITDANILINIILGY